MDNRDTRVNVADAEEATVADIVKMATKVRQNLELEIKELNKLLDEKRAELNKLNEVVNFKSIDHRH